MTDSYPVKTKQFGDFVRICSYDTYTIKYIKELLLEQYLRVKESSERSGSKVFCTFTDVEWIEKPFGISPNVPFNIGGTIGWKCSATGRAFYMMRLGYLNIRKRYPNKKNVPKRKRGKYMPKLIARKQWGFLR